jgi:two-component system, NtrC family, response regulator PilR
MSRASALIVDDESDIRELIRMTLERMGLCCIEAGSIAKAERALESQHFDLCLTDMRLPDGSGISLVKSIQSQHDSCPVAVITAHGNVELAVEALKAGAFDFVSKPIELNVLRALVQTALRLSDSSAALVAAHGIETRLLGDSQAIQQTRVRAAKLARSQAPVHVSGESGTGKELVAQMIHALGPRASARFVPVNCGAISPELIESELFGHMKGSFTGAHADNPGLFQAAAGGTLFLDEIAELALPMQVKLLRAIQEKSVRPVGANEEVPVDVRILSATHKNLGQLVEQGEFRQDLFYRVNVIELQVPPLRERSGDIEVLANNFLGKWSGPIEPAPKLSDEALAALERYAFPGNVRELENILERAMTLADGHFIEVFDLALPHASASSPPLMHYGRQSLDDYLARVEVETIEDALRQAAGNKTAAARLLGLKFGALRYRMQKLGLE